MLRLFSFVPTFGLRAKIVWPVVSLYTGETLREIPLLSQIFNEPIRRDLVHNAFHYYNCLNRKTTHRVKRYSEISGSNQKMRPQKGSGRARMGHKRVSHLSKGGKVHGPVMRDYSISMNKKTLLKALKVILTARLAEGNLTIVDSCPEGVQKTREAAKIMSQWGKCLFINQDFTAEFLLSIRGLEYVIPKKCNEVTVKDLVLNSKVLITEEGIQLLQQRVLQEEHKLYSNRKLYRKLEEEAKEDPIVPVPITFKALLTIAEKHNLDVN